MDIHIKIKQRNEQLQRLRKIAGFSQSQLATATGINVRVLQEYERGSRDLNGAKLSTILKLCIALDCELLEIITNEETAGLLRLYKSRTKFLDKHG